MIQDDMCGECGKEKCYLTWCEEPCEGACRTMNTPDQCHGHPKQEGLSCGCDKLFCTKHKESENLCKQCGKPCHAGEEHNCRCLVCRPAPVKQEGKECEVYGPNEGGPAGVCKEHSHVDAVCPTPKSGGMEERVSKFSDTYLCCCDGEHKPFTETRLFLLSELSRQKTEEDEKWLAITAKMGQEMERQAKELNERWEGRMARVREAIEKSKYRMAETDDLIYHNGGLDAALAAFDKAAALKD